MNWKKTAFWIIAVIITISTAVYQRMTGPTYPRDFKFTSEGTEYEFSLPRSQNGYKDAQVSLEIDDPSINGILTYRKFKSGEDFDTLRMKREGETLTAWLPKQPAAGKLEYGIELFRNGEAVSIPANEKVVIRFKDEVPAWVLIPHILFIFTAMLLSNLTAIYALAGYSSYRFYVGLTLIMFILGGMIMGPIVQKFAFGEFWTGFPRGKDLTDNKSLIAFIFWVIAWLGNRKNANRKYLVYLAALVNLAIALIPHSLRGSELDYESGEIQTGIIYLVNFLG